MRRFVLALGVIFPLLLAAYAIPSGDLVLLVGASAGLALVVSAAGSRPIQRRFHVFSSPETKFRRVYDELDEVRFPIREFVLKRGGPTPRAEWEPRVEAVDAAFWRMLNDVFYARVGSIRHTNPKITDLTGREYESDASWAWMAKRFLDMRRNLLDELMGDLPKS